jgi:glycosyltransferase involved in cell wall biosynthesis
LRSNAAAKIESGIDVLVVPMTTLSLPSWRVPSILCVHDIQHEYHPEYFSFRERASRWGSYRLSCWAASAVQASSLFVRDCLLEKFQFLPARKIFVAPEGVDFEVFDPKAPMEPPPTEVDTVPGSFLFYPAQLWPHKNHLLLVEALTVFRDRNGYEMPCLLTGQDCGMLQPILDSISGARLSKVRYLGKVPFTQLLWLYSNCKAVLALGLHESSSLPLREGAAFGKPLICANIPPNEELARDLFLLPFACRSPADLSARFDELISCGSVLAEKSAQNKKRARRFNWGAIAVRYIGVASDLHRAAKQKARAVVTA